ncbi:D-alanyl-D-alanine dipeptidase [Pseudodesulfovibrio hydrargyri]|uniref:D-alanyl-D-alanine dipeptidase n=1 Tax=Pseudodesulfovibrio hydrargyri TaxID=2125990 RepID=A0A1J5MTF8_9BACT|nr:M15 family metallopeptidase [Pseudodesulfovibrio hydrargyri]OIQ49290.1 D-alanyl-D-alanine dipeptidase [Pseudodesulfovibrio hydrargyri]
MKHRRATLALRPVPLVLLVLLLLPATAFAEQRPEGFVTLNEFLPGAVYDVKYYTGDNFVGARVDGYEAPKVLVAVEAARALKAVQEDVARFGLCLKLFDGYRPQRAVNHFMRWAEDLDDTRTKAAHYPDVDKRNLFRDGYIAARSGHSRGSTVDLTLVDKATGRELDMGTPFDFFGPESWPENPDFPPQVRANRALLRAVMLGHGFKPYEAEWWHFTLRDEPYPETYFDFPVE